MAAAGRRDLFLSIGGTPDPLKQALKVGKGALVEFGGDVGKQLEEIERRFRQLGGSDVEASAKNMEAAFRRSFVAIRGQAEEALKLPTTSVGSINLNVPEAKAAAVAARQEAQALREIADAAARVAAAETGATAAERAYAVAAQARAIAAEEGARGLSEQAVSLARLQAELDAAGVSQVRFNAVQRQGTASDGARRAGLQQLSFQVNDIASGISSGVPYLQIFSQQASQVTQAIGVMSGNAKGFAAFLGGPWGALITAGVVVLTPFVAKLFDAAEAAKEAKLGNDGLADAQSALGKMFDLQSGKLEHQNNLLRINARLTAANLRTQALNAETSSKQAFEDAGTPSLLVRALGTLALGTSDGRKGLGQETRERGVRNARVLGRIGRQVLSGQLDGEKAVNLAERTDYRGTGIEKADFLKAIADAASVKVLRKNADLIDQTLDTGKLPDELKRTSKPKKPKVDHTAERAADRDRAYQNQLDTAQDAYARAQLALADTADARLKVELSALQAGKVQNDLAIDDQVAAKKITSAQAEKLKALGAQTEQLQEEAARRRRAAALLDQEFATEEKARSARVALLEIDADMASTRTERLKLERQLLAEQQAARRAELQRIANDPTRSQVDRDQARTDIGRLPAQEAAERSQTEKRLESPLAAYRTRLLSTVGDMHDALEGVAVNGFERFEDEFGRVISGTESVGKAFKNMASSIIADLARIAIEKAIVGALSGGSFFGLKFADGGQVQAHAAGGLISGPGGPRSDSILSWLSDGEFVVNAAATKRALPLLQAINDNNLPGFANGGYVGNLNALRASDLSGGEMREISAHRDQRVVLEGNVQVGTNTPLLTATMEQVSLRTIGVAADPIMAGAEARTRKAIGKIPLPGGYA